LSFKTEIDLAAFKKLKSRMQLVEIKIIGELTANELLIIAERTLELAQQKIAFDTGAAWASLQIRIDPSGKRVEIGSDGGIRPNGERKIYLRYLEFGTSFMRAQPFLFPSAIIALTEFKARYPLKIRELARIGV